MNSAPDQTPVAIDPASLTKDPPTTLTGILKSLGPGLIIAGSIVGSGELIATTSTGAAAGFSLLAAGQQSVASSKQPVTSSR